jgi:hypothetical protein
MPLGPIIVAVGVTLTSLATMLIQAGFGADPVSSDST